MIPEPLQPYLNPLEPIPTDLPPTVSNFGAPMACLLFDVYGTLFISASGDIGTAEAASKRPSSLSGLLAGIGCNRPPEAVQRRFFDTIRQEHARLQQQGVDHPEVDIVDIWMAVLEINEEPRVREFAEAYECMVNPVWPMPGALKLIRQTASASMPMGIISNAQFYTPDLFRWFFDRNLTELGFADDLLWFSYQWQVAKPSPVLFEKARRRLRERGIPPDAVLYVGNDMLNDIRPAAGAGFRTALFAGDRRSLRMREKDARCRQVQPDMVVTSLDQLCSLLPDYSGESL